jgi:hypothetical protein
MSDLPVDEVVSNGNLPVVGCCVACDSHVSDVISRYFAAVETLTRQIEGLESSGVECYDLEPVLIATNVNPAVLERLPSAVGTMHVKNAVRNRRLYIVHMSSGAGYSAGVGNILGQTGMWASPERFSISFDAVMTYGGGKHSAAPDVAIEASSESRQPGEEHCRLSKLCAV